MGISFRPPPAAVALLLAMMTAGEVFSAKELYVSPGGNDDATGTEEAPLKTLHKARDKVREINDGNDDIIVYLRGNVGGGYHFLDSTLRLDQRDGGKNGRSVTYTAYAGEAPVISGGMRIEGWTVHDQGKNIHVLVDETRPRLQGARLTAWELIQYDIPFDIISDNAAGYFLSTGQVQKVVFGADRVAANGDVANKIGTYMLALAAHDNDVPRYSVVPTSTVDLSLASGDMIPIEERRKDEVLELVLKGLRVTPENASARNPAFDVTPHRLITAIVTEKGVVYPPFEDNLRNAVETD